MQRNSKRRDAPNLEQAPYTTVDKDGRVVWEPGLPAMVTSRRQPRAQPKQVDPDELPVPCELKTTLRLTSEAKPDWLYKALRAVPKGRAQVSDIYNIVTHPKFASGVKEWHGQRMLRMVRDNADLFSEKQRSTLVKKCELARLFRSPSRSASRSRSRSASACARVEAAVPRTEDDGPTSSAVANASSATRIGGIGDARQVSLENGAAEPSSSKERPPPSATDFPSADKERAVREQRERLSEAMKSREREREDELRRQKAERHAQEEREKARKAKLGSAFSLGDEDDEDAPEALALMRNREKRRTLGEDTPIGAGISTPLPAKEALPGDLAKPNPSLRALQNPNVNPQFVEAMGGDKVLHEVHALLMQKVAPENEVSPSAPREAHRRRGAGTAAVERKGRGAGPVPDAEEVEEQEV
eukprot:CAMPEP_0117466494 /NCGR_PEP_ID=MMETSP0784-20121206/5170_1 /TAXON_ID=39447 /ORGANISM="" /LENGTH=414 /DNA_ID=CAMNT_0005260435 /DNA_START=172 /DNA_END=1414 /DNA_ORIENTATION=+